MEMRKRNSANRILFLGQKGAGEQCFRLLKYAQSDTLRICGVVSNVSKEVWWGSNTIYQQCVSEKIPFVPNDKRNNDLISALIGEQGINIIVSVQHPWILPVDILSAVNFNAFNLHNAKLPEYKGYNSCSHAILNGERFYTSTVHWMAEKVDMGAISIEETFEISPDETARSLYEKAIRAGLSAFGKLLDCLRRQEPMPKKPIAGEGTFYPRNSLDGLRRIENVLDVEEMDKKTRAMYFPPFEPAYYLVSGTKIYMFPERFISFVNEFEPGGF
jgi:methionyl-tRNA formyltransferase